MYLPTRSASLLDVALTLLWTLQIAERFLLYLMTSMVSRAVALSQGP